MEENYKAYLKSEEWKEKRRMILEKRGRFCEKCGKGPEVLLDIHHLTYKRIFNEKEEDLMILCRRCHEKVHRDNNNSKKKPNKKLTDAQRKDARIKKLESKLSSRDRKINERYKLISPNRNLYPQPS